MGTSVSARYFIAATAMACGASVAQGIPEKCALEGSAAYLEYIEKRCPGLRVTLKGRELLALVARTGNAACISFSRAKLADDIKALPTMWCSVAATVTEPDKPGSMVARR